MKKTIIIICSVIMLLGVMAGGLVFYIVSTPEYALKNIIKDVNASGMEGLEPHLTENARKTLDTVSTVTESDLFNTIMGFINQNGYAGVLKSEIQEIEWGVDDVLKSKDKASVILSFNYEDRIIGTIEISMVREEGNWKINGINYPEIDEIKW